MRARRRIGAGAVLGAALALVGMTSARGSTGQSAVAAAEGGGPTWTKPVRLSRKGGGAVVGAGPGSYAVIAYIRIAKRRPNAPRHGNPFDDPGTGVAYAITRHPDGRYSRPRRLSGAPGIAELQLGVGEGGETVVAWLDRRQRINVVTRLPTGIWQERKRLSGPVADAPNRSELAAAVGPDGTAVLAWLTQGRQRDLKKIMAARRLGDGPFGDPVKLQGQQFPSRLVAAAGVGGSAAVLWPGLCPLSGRGQPSLAAVADPTASFSKPLEIPGSKCPVAGFDAAIGPEGEVAAIFSGDVEEAGPLFRVRLGLGGAAGFDHTTDLGGRRPNFASVATDSTGRLVGAWNEGSGAHGAIVADIGDTASGLAGADTRFDEADARGFASLAMSWSGYGLVAWQETDRPYRLVASLLGPGDRQFAAPVSFSTRMDGKNLAVPGLAAGRDGDRYLVWSTGKRDGLFLRSYE